jgi:hypothetical protein
MKATRVIRNAALLTATVLAAACSSDSGVGPSPGGTTTLVQALGEMSLPSMPGLGSLASPDASQSMPALVPSSCAYTAASQSFVCPPTTRSGLTVTRSFTLLDASGLPQSQFDPRSTSAVRTNTKIAGKVTTGLFDTTIDEVRELTLSGLLTGTHVLNGHSTTIVVDSASLGDSALTLKTTITTTISDLVLPSSTGANTWPKSGTVTIDTVDEMGSSSATLTTHVVITFDGTSKATATVTTGGSTSRCIVDLANPLLSTCTG